MCQSSCPGVGSSPLARGTRALGAKLDLKKRFIPARAGNTVRQPGEKLTERGSSPLARGTLPKPEVEIRATRFIPARAGNTQHQEQWNHPGSVHPRSRGEHSHDCITVFYRVGSSPLARGTHAMMAFFFLVYRFIPARAGNTGKDGSTGSREAVHPRSRGEHIIIWSKIQHLNGSSPLARGTPGLRTIHKPLYRFIPARAGNTVVMLLNSTASPVHPRSRGEHHDPGDKSVDHDGSSPLARGTLLSY